MSCTIETLPVELFRSILIYLSPEDTSSLAQTCRRLNEITRDEQVWQHYFRTRYQYSTRVLQYPNGEYLSELVVQSIRIPSDSTWQELFAKRVMQDKHIRSLLNEIVSTRKNRIYNVELIASTYGLLAVDVLKSYFPSSTMPFQFRRLTYEYYSLEIVRLICREIALNLLSEMKNRQNISTDGRSLLNALYIIQCFHPNGIFLSLNRLHSIGQKLLADNPHYSTLSLPEQCQLILLTMQKENFCSANGGVDYYDIENSFLFSAFNGKPTIPLTLVAIFCALAEECGLKARPLGLPGEVMAQVDHSSNRDPPLIISVFDGKIVSLTEINERLADTQDIPLTHPISATPINELVIRSARNMINCITKYSTSPLNSYGLYIAASVLKILGSNTVLFALDSMFNSLKEHFPMDIRVFESLATPTAETSADLRRVRSEDSNPSILPFKKRSSSVPKFHIGQIFQHAHYHYWAVIHGWDSACTASTLWQMRMGVSHLARAAEQPFYQILAADSSRRYVAEDNIDIVAFDSLDNTELKTSIIEQLCNAHGIGKYFHSFDPKYGRFLPIDELKQEYPD